MALIARAAGELAESDGLTDGAVTALSEVSMPTDKNSKREIASLPSLTEIVLSDPALPPTDQARLWTDPMLGGIEATVCRFVHHRFAPHTHDTLMIGLIEAGAKTFARGRTEHIVGVGGVSIVNPGEAHTGARASEGELRYRALYVSPRFLDPDRAVEVRAATLGDALVFRALWAASNAIIGHSPILEREERLLVALALLDQRYAQPGREPAAAPWRVRRARELLPDASSLDLSIEEVARSVGLSPFHLMRSFRRHFALPMHAFQLGIRVQRAKAMLRSSPEAMAAIALACGFAGQSHLTRRFKAHTGLIPDHSDQYPCAQSRSPMDMMRHGWSTSLFQASQQ
jgi:AraC-like DNA-binding protein